MFFDEWVTLLKFLGNYFSAIVVVSSFTGCNFECNLSQSNGLLRRGKQAVTLKRTVLLYKTMFMGKFPAHFPGCVFTMLNRNQDAF